MSKKSVKENVKQPLDAANPWEQAISDAESLIKMLKIRIQGLRGAIVGFKDMRDQGAPWPGESSPASAEDRHQ